MQEDIGLGTVVPVRVNIDVTVADWNSPLQNQVVYPVWRTWQRVAVNRDGEWAYEDNPRGGLEVWLGTKENISTEPGKE